MPLEIEHKFIVKSDAWKQTPPQNSFPIVQGYLLRGDGKTVRVRIKGSRGFLTIKGAGNRVSREEFEYEIPVEDALKMLELFCPTRIEKTRYEVQHAGHTWEVDVFDGLNAGLVIAEIELDREDESYEKPTWLGEDVTLDKRYTNASLSKHPFSTW